eukprot:Pgem_evm1s2564
MSNILEKLVQTTLIDFLYCNNLLSLHQSGLLTNRQTKDLLFRVMQEGQYTINLKRKSGTNSDTSYSCSLILEKPSTRFGMTGY